VFDVIAVLVQALDEVPGCFKVILDEQEFHALSCHSPRPKW
jgi:hypothetical protein